MLIGKKSLRSWGYSSVVEHLPGICARPWFDPYHSLKNRKTRKTTYTPQTTELLITPLKYLVPSYFYPSINTISFIQNAPPPLHLHLSSRQSLFHCPMLTMFSLIPTGIYSLVRMPAFLLLTLTGLRSSTQQRPRLFHLTLISFVYASSFLRISKVVPYMSGLSPLPP